MTTDAHTPPQMMMKKLIGGGLAALALGLGMAPVAQADPGQDQHFVDIVHANGVPGQPAELIAYANDWCFGTGPILTMTGPLMGQGVWGDAFYKIQVAASQTYCPMKIVMPPRQWPSFHDLTH